MEEQRAQIINALSADRPAVSQVYLYDAKGSEIYEAITYTEDYYLTNKEIELLKEHRSTLALYPDEVKAGLVAPTLSQQAIVELGAGSGRKTTLLFDALTERAESTVYVPIDVSAGALVENAEIVAAYNKAAERPVAMHPVEGCFDKVLPKVDGIYGRKTYCFFGSSLGNYADEEAIELMTMVERRMQANERFLIGVDTAHSKTKPGAVIERAYNDREGHTAAFTLNALAHINRVAGLNFDWEHGWKHVATYEEDAKAIHTYLEALSEQTVVAADGSFKRVFAKGERIFMELSRKFTVDHMEQLGASSGLHLSTTWTTHDGYYMVCEFISANVCQRSLERTHWLFQDIITEQNVLVRPIELRFPYLFYYGHLPAFADLKALEGTAFALPQDAFYRANFERGIDPNVDDPSQCHRSSKLLEKDQWPAMQQFAMYADRVYRMLSQKAQAMNGYEYATLLALQHDAAHHETLLYIVAEQNRAASVAGGFSKRPASATSSTLSHSMVTGSCTSSVEFLPVSVQAGTARLGMTQAEYVTEGFAWDNELPAHVIQVDAFQCSPLPVTNAEFLEFVLSGGYTRPELWGVDFEWAQGQNAPLRFEHTKDGWLVHSPLDGPASMGDEAGSWPAHVTLIEARAYCRWKGDGARVMTEPEYHRLFGDDAAANFHAAALNGNSDFKHRGCVPVGSMDDGVSVDGTNVYDLVGNGWEWTDTEFSGFPGFKPMEMYAEYSVDFFDGSHFVLKGASVFTPRIQTRLSYRNFYQEKYPHVMAKFRVVYSQ